jgi:hypothetical protein
MAIKRCANCGESIEGSVSSRCPASGTTHKFARADFERAEMEERQTAAKISKEK